MKKLTVSLADDLHEDLRVLAFKKQTSMAALVRYALDKTFEDELDTIAGERALGEAIEDADSSVSWEEYKKKQLSGVRAAG